MNRLVAALGEPAARSECVTHVKVTPPRPGVLADWPGWVPDWVREGYGQLGVIQPWRHQSEAMTAGRQGHCVIATGTGSGKSLALWAPALAALDRPYELGRIAEVHSRASALYIAPTKALAADQMASLRALFRAGETTGLEVSTCDGDTPGDLRRFLASKADAILTNPDFLHFAFLPGHTRWAGFLRGLQYVLVDELHAYRGVMGAHVAWVMRRLRRLARHYGADPIFLAASATVSDPELTFARLIGEDPGMVTAIREDTSAHGERTFVLWRPSAFDGSSEDLPSPAVQGSGPSAVPALALGGAAGPADPPVGPVSRRSAPAEASQLLANLVDLGARALVFVRSRYSAEAVASTTRQTLGQPLAARVATYRGGYLPEERRALEGRLRSGALLGLVSTTALELGIDIAGLDAVITAGWPGTRVALTQQAGRAGRAGGDGLAVWVAGTDPLDSYLVAHPEAVLGAPLEAAVFDPSNPYVAAPHLAAAAAEWPIDASELPLLDRTAAQVMDALAQTGAVRQRGRRWFWILPERATDLTGLRDSGGGTVQVIENPTGRILGTVDSASAPALVHPGAVYVHQGDTFLVSALDLDGGLAMVDPAQPRYRTMPLHQSTVQVIDEFSSAPGALADWHFGMVDVTSQVTGFMRLRVPGLERIDTQRLDMPRSHLRTAATWITIPAGTIKEAGFDAAGLPGALHAAEHAAIGLLPLLATCDRWDLGGLSTAVHADTGEATIFIHDSVPGGAGFAERAYHRRIQLLDAVHALLAACPCDDGCPSCVQSPKCGNGNQTLSKAGALALVTALRQAGTASSGPDTPA
ncbi:MAG: DUF1998 domain-containing protein [Bifidobacteriaceae bacterium]|nr:DUF1998 domain-containing protein [Bifidobacteriaceae bacterium]